MARIERATSPLPRECSTTEPHGRRHGPGHRDIQACGDRLPHRSLEREAGIEPASLAWKAKVLPLNYSRPIPQRRLGGGGWIRTSVGVSQQIYSLPPLATRAPLRGEPATISPFEVTWLVLRLQCCGYSRQSRAGVPASTARRKSRARRKCPQPTKGTGPRVADSGDGWLHCSTRWPAPAAATSAALACA